VEGGRRGGEVGEGGRGGVRRRGGRGGRGGERERVMVRGEWKRGFGGGGGEVR